MRCLLALLLLLSAAVTDRRSADGATRSPSDTPTPTRSGHEESWRPGLALGRSAEQPSPTPVPGDASHPRGAGYRVVQWEWSYVQTPYIIATWLLLASVAKICE